MKHTPGPWSVGDIREQNVHPLLRPSWELPVHVGRNGDAAGGLGNCLGIVYMGGAGALINTKEAIEANGRLIAASPTMYDALERIIEALEMRAREHACTGIHCSNCNPMELVEEGRNAIAQADGKS